MKTYNATIGVYVRQYASLDFESDNPDPEFLKATTIQLAQVNGKMEFYDTDWDNMALPSIVSLSEENGTEDIIEGHDFSMTAEDAAQWNAMAMLQMLNRALALMPLGTIERAKWVEDATALAALCKHVA